MVFGRRRRRRLQRGTVPCNWLPCEQPLYERHRIDERRVDRPAMILTWIVVGLDDRPGATCCRGGGVLELRRCGGISEACPDKYRPEQIAASDTPPWPRFLRGPASPSARRQRGEWDHQAADSSLLPRRSHVCRRRSGSPTAGTQDPAPGTCGLSGSHAAVGAHQRCLIASAWPPCNGVRLGMKSCCTNLRLGTLVRASLLQGATAQYSVATDRSEPSPVGNLR